MNIIAIIPARKGSKSIRNKNIRKILGKPLLAYSIEHAKESRYINRVIISTDSIQYGKLALKYGAEFPFLRPDSISGDNATDFEVFKHALDWLYNHEHYQADICVHLRPTYPIRDPKDIDNMIEILIKNELIDSVRSIVKAPYSPFKMWFKSNDNILQPVLKTEIKEAYNQPRQLLPQVYLQNACIDVIRTKTILEKQSMTGEIIYGYEMNHFYDIDEPEELAKVRQIIRKEIKHG